MTDQFDQASDTEQAARDRAITAVRDQANPIHPGQPDCADCGQPIPPARRAAAPGALRCIHCATRAESRKGRPC
jgi:phage/conjugal plasmid C-4 type zinc finger TraR family protein